MFFNIRKLKASPGLTEKVQVEEEISSFTLGDDQVEFAGPANILIEAVNTEGNIFVKGQVKVTVILTCSRCLEKFRLVLETAFERDFKLAKENNGEESDDVLVVKGDQIDLSHVIRESIILELPMKQICSEKCRGLCNQCGINLNEEECDCETDNVDPRLEALKDYFK